MVDLHFAGPLTAKDEKDRRINKLIENRPSKLDEGERIAILPSVVSFRDFEVDEEEEKTEFGEKE